MSKQVNIEVSYFSDMPGQGRKLSHVYAECWLKTDCFCPRCGAQEVWRDNGGGDYYVGELHLCAACNGAFHLPGGVLDAADEQDKQRLSALIAQMGDQ